MPPTAPLIDWSFLAQLGIGVLVVATVMHIAARLFRWWLERVPVLDEPAPTEDVDLDDIVAAQPTPIPFVDTALERCATCGTPVSSLHGDECWHCGAEFDDHGPRAA